MAKILVVDDESDLQVLIKQKFRKQIRDNIYEFVFAMNGYEALEQLEQHHRTLQSLNKMKSSFLSLASHELRTPLTTFQMYSEMLADGLVTTEDQRKQYLLTLKDESKRLSAMVSNVLALHKTSISIRCLSLMLFHTSLLINSSNRVAC